MHDQLTVAVVQVSSQENKEANLAAATSLVRQAAAGGASVIALPENVNYVGDDSLYVEVAEPIPGPTIAAFQAVARECDVYLLTGSVVEHDVKAGKYFNASVLIGPGGEIVARYRKIHLFDVEIGEAASEQESRFLSPGTEIVTAQIHGRTVGLTICYDLRFPELYRELVSRGAELLFIPSAFTLYTGKDHWQTLVTARAIENQCFVVAPGQFGPHAGGWSYGRSMIVDPWGTVLATVPDGEGFAVAQLDFSRVAEVRAQIPALANRRLRSSAATVDDRVLERA